MEERFLKERYEEWANHDDCPYTPNARMQLIVAEDDKRKMNKKNEWVLGNCGAVLIDFDYSALASDYLQAGFYAGYEMASYMLCNRLVA